MNRFSKQRKVISEYKYSRILSNNLESVGCAMIFKDHNSGWVSSLSAVLSGDHLYAKFPCKKQKASRLSVYTVKYNVKEPLDNLVFIPYPQAVEVKF